MPSSWAESCRTSSSRMRRVSSGSLRRLTTVHSTLTPSVGGVLAQRARRRHPVQRLVGAAVGVHQHRAVGLDHQHPGGHREVGGQPSRVVDLAARHDESHGRGNLQWPACPTPPADVTIRCGSGPPTCVTSRAVEDAGVPLFAQRSGDDDRARRCCRRPRPASTGTLAARVPPRRRRRRPGGRLRPRRSTSRATPTSSSSRCCRSTGRRGIGARPGRGGDGGGARGRGTTPCRCAPTATCRGTGRSTPALGLRRGRATRAPYQRRLHEHEIALGLDATGSVS